MTGDRVPDFELKVWLSPAGYQADVFYQGEEIASKCRDFKRDSLTMDLILAWLRIESFMMMERLRKVVV